MQGACVRVDYHERVRATPFLGWRWRRGGMATTAVAIERDHYSGCGGGAAKL